MDELNKILEEVHKIDLNEIRLYESIIADFVKPKEYRHEVQKLLDKARLKRADLMRRANDLIKKEKADEKKVNKNTNNKK